MSASSAATSSASSSDVKETIDTVAEDATKSISSGKLDMKTVGAFGIISSLVSIVFGLAFCIGAAKLSYDRFGSMGWAILDFFFAYLYYPYYAFFVSVPVQQPATGLFGGKRRKH